MQFGINWNEGYEVCALTEDARGFRRWMPLRNFGDHQGDARIFKEADCPDLTDRQIRMLIKSFDRKRKYKRIDSRTFRIDRND